MSRPDGRRRPAVGRDDRGSSAVELVGALPVVVVVVLVALQALAGVYATQATNQAVRDGARAQSLGQPVDVAVERSLPGGLTVERIGYPAGGVELEVRVPRVLPGLDLTVTREAFMPRTLP